MTLALANIARYERFVGTRADFASPFRNPGRVCEWVQTCNRETGSNERPIELDDDGWDIDAENRRDTVLADRAAQIAQNADDEAGK